MDYGFSAHSRTESLGSTSSSLIERVKSRDADAWRRLVMLYGPVVFVWCRQAGLRAHDAADQVQEAFLAVHASVAQFRRDRPGDSFRGWLWTITRNKIRDYYRRRRESALAQGGSAAQNELAQVPDLAPGSSESHGPLLGFVERRALDLIRAEFEERTWIAFWQTVVDGRRAADVAADLGMDHRAVRQAKYRVLKRLRMELDGLLD